MSDSNGFSRGDVVIHPRRPEWGEGVIDEAVAVTHEGKPAQRLVVRFANQGLVTINTGVATLTRKDASTIMSTTTTPASSSIRTEPAKGNGSEGNGWLASLDGQQKSAIVDLAKLPETMTDPFAGVGKRLQATLDAYRFSTEPRSLIEWGIAQTGLNDPLSKFTRHELESAFPRFARDRDNNLFELVRLIKKQSKTELFDEAMRNTSNQAAKNALQRAMRS